MADIEAFDMGSARKKWVEKEAMQSHGKAQNIKMKLNGSIDKRSLRKTGRTEQYNLRVREGFKKDVADHAGRMGFSTAIEFIEAAVAAFIAKPDGGKK